MVVSPDAGRMNVAERYTNALGADPSAYVHKRRSTCSGQHGRGQGDHRRGPRPRLRVDRRHDRHRRHHLRRSRPAVGQRRREGDRRGHPRRLLRPSNRPPSQRRHRDRASHRHAPPCSPRKADRQDRGPLGRSRSSPVRSLRCSPTRPSAKSSPAITSPEPPGGACLGKRTWHGSLCRPLARKPQAFACRRSRQFRRP